MSREHMGELGKMRDTHGGEVERLRVELAATVLARDKAKSSLARKERIVDKLVLTNLVGPTKVGGCW